MHPLAMGSLAQPLSPVSDVQMTVNDVVVDLCDHTPLMQALRDRLAHRWGGPSAMAVGSVNIDHLHHFGRDRLDLANEPEATGITWVWLADGAPVVARAALLTGRVWPRLTGADLLPDVLAMAERDLKSVAFLGGTGDMHDALAARLADRHPDLNVVGYWAPTREVIDSAEESRRVARELKHAGADIIVVGLGKPRQELWIHEYGAMTGASVLLAFGASADFVAGKVSRAPKVLRTAGLEWAYRLAKEPRRLAKRYLVEGPESALLLRTARRL
jgi:N-acetylglucosaminyldiphosphoundecaprenol N-acetyl-beta-D-mannosaminyltransferase